jgi:hypothetical protein
MTISGNAGEWSEIYVFLKLLSDRVLRRADENLEPKDGIGYEIRKIIRKENVNMIEYVVNEKDGVIDIVSNGNTLAQFKFEKFTEEADYLFKEVRVVKGRTYSFDRTERFMKEIFCEKLKAPSKDKTDISMVAYDSEIREEASLGFSIKSYVRSAPTLLNASMNTNLIFEIDDMNDDDMKIVNRMVKATNVVLDENVKERTDIMGRMKFLKDKGYMLRYVGTESKTFRNNMMMTDADIPVIVGAMLVEFYMNGVNNVTDLIEAIAKKNPLGHDISDRRSYYSHKMKRFLTDIATGMVPDTEWTGTEKANGGYIIVKESGETVCYHVYHRNDFEDYLMRNTCLDKPSASRHQYASIDNTVDGKYRMKLNLQIRFKQAKSGRIRCKR